MSQVPLFSPAPSSALLGRVRVAGRSHEPDEPPRFASYDESAAEVSAAIARTGNGP
jgi:hypothetical protein